MEHAGTHIHVRMGDEETVICITRVALLFFQKLRCRVEKRRSLQYGCRRFCQLSVAARFNSNLAGSRWKGGAARGVGGPCQHPFKPDEGAGTRNVFSPESRRNDTRSGSLA